jgi:hypothetical protein
LIERIRVDVAVGSVGADVTEIRVSGEREFVGEFVVQTEVERRGAIPRDIGDALNAAPVLFEKTKILEAVAGEPIAGVAEAQRDAGAAVAPTELSEKSADLRG